MLKKFISTVSSNRPTLHTQSLRAKSLLYLEITICSFLLFTEMLYKDLNYFQVVLTNLCIVFIKPPEHCLDLSTLQQATAEANEYLR